MAEGIVTSSDAEFRGILTDTPGPLAQLALQARALIFDVLPQTVEVVWPSQKSAGYGTGPKKMSEQFVWLAPQTRHLVFGFYYGTELPAPEELLEGTGRLMRHVKIRTDADLQNPELRRLVEVSTTHRVPPPAR
jgi:hypothetical protein